MMLVALYRFPAHVQRVDVSVQPFRQPPDDERVDAAWEKLRQQNPRLFGGGIYNVLAVDADRGRITAAYDLYKRLVVQPDVETGVNQLSVSALATAPGAGGQPCVLIGQRGQQTRIYGGMWQLCPAGGVEPPDNPADLADIGHDKIRADLAREFTEEVGLDLGDLPARPLAVVHDRIARSYDIVLRVEFAAAQPLRPQHGSGWEHLDLRWLPIAEVPAFDRAQRIIEPTRALFRSLGWLTPGPA